MVIRHLFTRIYPAKLPWGRLKWGSTTALDFSRNESLVRGGLHHSTHSMKVLFCRKAVCSQFELRITDSGVGGMRFTDTPMSLDQVPAHFGSGWRSVFTTEPAPITFRPSGGDSGRSSRFRDRNKSSGPRRGNPQ